MTRDDAREMLTSELVCTLAREAADGYSTPVTPAAVHCADELDERIPRPPIRFKRGDVVAHTLTGQIGTYRGESPDGKESVQWDDGTAETVLHCLLARGRRAKS